MSLVIEATTVISLEKLLIEKKRENRIKKEEKDVSAMPGCIAN